MHLHQLRRSPRLLLLSFGLSFLLLSLPACNEFSLGIENVDGNTRITMGPDGGLPALKFALGVLNVGVFPVSDNYTTDDNITITAVDGVNLEANIFVPNDIVGTAPAVIFVNSWGLNEYEYLTQAGQLADKGYIVLSYSTRGFGKSGGLIDTVGPNDVSDFQQVVDFLIANYPVNPAAIASGGISYGSGMSLIGAANDSRIKAVIALSAWGDLADALFGNDSPRLVWGDLLVIVGDAGGNPDPIIAEHWADIKAQNWAKEAGIRAWAAPRSPINHVTELNANGTAIYFGKAYGDNLFQPNSILDMFSQLTVPKHIDMVQGTHGSAELMPTVQGLETNYLWDNAFDWLDIHLKGETNALSTADPIRMKVKFQEKYDSFTAFPVSANEEVFYLNPRAGAMSGTLTDSAYAAGNSKDRINAKAGSRAFATQIPAISQLLEQNNMPIQTVIALASRELAISYKSEAMNETLAIRGNPNVSLLITPDDTRVQVVVYLYDMNSLGVGKLITHGVSSLRNATPGVSVRMDFDLVTTAYDVPVGNKLVLAFDTQDAQYMPLATTAYNIDFNYDASEQSTLTIPLP